MGPGLRIPAWELKLRKSNPTSPKYDYRMSFSLKQGFCLENGSSKPIRDDRQAVDGAFRQGFLSKCGCVSFAARSELQFVQSVPSMLIPSTNTSFIDLLGAARDLQSGTFLKSRAFKRVRGVFFPCAGVLPGWFQPVMVKAIETEAGA